MCVEPKMETDGINDETNFIRRPAIFIQQSDQLSDDESRPVTPPMDQSLKLNKSLGVIMSPQSPPYRKIRSMKIIESPRPFIKSRLDHILTSTPNISPCAQNSFRRSSRSSSLRFQRSRIGNLNQSDVKEKLISPLAYINPFSPSYVNTSQSSSDSRAKRYIKRSLQKRIAFDSDDNNEEDDYEDQDSLSEPIKKPRLCDFNIPRYQEEFLELEVIGIGEHGQVYKCLNLVNGMEYAVKRGLKPVMNERIAHNEIYAHGVLEHPNIVRNYSSWTENDYVFMQNEYCNGGSLEEIIKQGSLEERHLRKMLEHIAQGLRMLLRIVLLKLIVVTVLGKSIIHQCYTKNMKIYNLMSTMTPYDEVRGEITKFKGCKPKSLWGFIRHGTRYPHDSQIARFSKLTVFSEEVLNNHAEKRGGLCSEDLKAIGSWSLAVNEDQDMLLTMSGLEELRKFGQRLGNAFSDLMEGPSDLDIKISSKERTRQSAEALTTGLFGKNLKIDKRNEYDDLIKNEKNCPNWKKNTKNTKRSEEMEKFKSSKEWREVIENVSARLGFQRNLQYGELKDIYYICAFEYSWYHNPKDSPWCFAFSDRDLKVLEFAEDVNYYYKSGYGNEFTPKLGCFLVKDMIEKLSKDSPKATLYFGHSTGMRKLLTSLNIGREPTLSGDGFNTSSERIWRTSYLTPFAANLLAVKYECKDDLKVAVFLNEKLVALSACAGEKTCSLGRFTSSLNNLTNTSFCNRDFCTDGTHTSDKQPEEVDDEED